MNSDTFKDRLKLIMGDESNSSFAGKCRLSEGTLRRYLRGNTFPPLDTLQVIAEVGNCSLAWLASGDGTTKRGEAKYVLAEVQKTADVVGEPGEGFVKIPRYEVKASAGGGAVIHSEQIVDHLSFRADWVRNALGVPVSSLALINVMGDSMEPTLSDGDLILIDMSTRRVQDNAVYVLQFNGSLLVKRIQRKLDGSVIVKGDNTLYEPEMVGSEAVGSLNVIGRVVWCGRRM